MISHVLRSLGQLLSLFKHTFGENIIATTKIRNNYGAIQSFIFPILRWQYWTFLYCPPFSYRSSNLLKVVALNLFDYFCMCFVDWFIASLLYCFTYSFRSSNYATILLKALAKSNGNLIAITFKSEKERQQLLSR